MTITTEFRLSSSSLPLVSIPEMLQPDTLECVHGLCLQQSARMFIVKIDADNYVSEEQLNALDEVMETTTLGRADDTMIYKLIVNIDDALSHAFNPNRSESAQLEPTIVTPNGWHERKVYKDYDAFNESRTRCESYGISLELVSISSESSASEESHPYGLTDRQYEALTLAFSRGYYESPRQISTEELAEELGITQPSVSDLLRRGERQLLSSALQSRGYLNTPSR
jgi:predicted DNA binding protein